MNSLLELSKDTAQYMVDGIRYVCDNFKNRYPGSQSERDAQAYFKSELEQWSDNVEMEDFDVYPHSFMGWIPPSGLIGIISVLLFTFRGDSFASPIIATVLTLLALSCFVFQFLLYRPFIDKLFPKKVSRNVMAKRAPSGELKRRIIFGGHADAAWEWTYSYYGQLKTLAPVMGGSIGGLFFISVMNIVWLVKSIMMGSANVDSTFWYVIGIIELVLIPFFFLIMFFINWKIVVDGANDNLSACYVAMGVLKEMADNDMRFENTEVCCLLTGSEEAGLRGALDYAKRHKEDLSDVETIYISMDTMREIEQLQVYTRGQTGTQKDSEEVGDLITEAGKNCGVDMPRAELYPGAVDAEGFSRHGLLAAGFCGVNHNPKTYYHTRLDTADNISEDCINLSLDICLECAKLYDENQGLAKYYENRKAKKNK